MKVSVSTGGIFSFPAAPGHGVRAARGAASGGTYRAGPTKPTPSSVIQNHTAIAALHILQGVDYPGHRHDHHHEADYLHHIGFHISLRFAYFCGPCSGRGRPKSPTHRSVRAARTRYPAVVGQDPPQRNDAAHEEKHGHDRQEPLHGTHRLRYFVFVHLVEVLAFALVAFVVHHPDACKHDNTATTRSNIQLLFDKAQNILTPSHTSVTIRKITATVKVFLFIGVLLS